MFFMTGFVVFLGVMLILVKLPRRLALRCLHHDLAIDLLVSAVTMFLHQGSFEGAMAAAVAGLLTSVTTSGLKRLVGYCDATRYYPGRLNLKLDV
jgi:hypothetical protein